MEYYPIPVPFEKIIKGQRSEDDVDLRLSIHQNIRFILKSTSMSYRFDQSFGSIMNKYHAATPPQNMSERKWRDKIRESIQKNIKQLLQLYETRVDVKNVYIDLIAPQGNINDRIAKIKVSLTGNLTIGRKEKFHFPDSEVLEEALEAFPVQIAIGSAK